MLVDYLERFVKEASTKPGIYQMFDDQGRLLYVGKANNLKARLSSYANARQKSKRIEHLIQHIADIQTTITETETDALLLEQNLIKSKHPKYNVLLRDDKSYPYIAVEDQEAPRIFIYRGKHKPLHAKLYGPYPNARAVYTVLNFVQKAFKIRHCTDAFYRHRSRPCLQYQINRCSAPCVEAIDKADYQAQVQLAIKLLEGNNQAVIKALTEKMQSASQTLNYELALSYRNLIQDIQHIGHTQSVHVGCEDRDVVAIVEVDSIYVIHKLMIRYGNVQGSDSYLPSYPDQEVTQEEVLSAFLKQHYLRSNHWLLVPSDIVLNQTIEDKALLEQILSEKCQHPVRFKVATSKLAQSLVAMAAENAHDYLRRHQGAHQRLAQDKMALQEALGLDRLECLHCFDISHFSGEGTTASCVVLGQNGFLKDGYRQYNIKGVRSGDDYHAIVQAIERHYGHLKAHQLPMPDLVVIDGGKNHLRMAHEALTKLGLQIPMIAIVKGRGRRPLYDQIITNQGIAVTIPPGAKRCVQRIRDEAHRFAISQQRKKLLKTRKRSILDQIPGVGAEKRKRLLLYFGGLQELKKCSKTDLARVPGIGDALAKRIYEHLHGE